MACAQVKKMIPENAAQRIYDPGALAEATSTRLKKKTPFLLPFPPRSGSLVSPARKDESHLTSLVNILLVIY